MLEACASQRINVESLLTDDSSDEILKPGRQTDQDSDDSEAEFEG